MIGLGSDKNTLYICCISSHIHIGLPFLTRKCCISSNIYVCQQHLFLLATSCVLSNSNLIGWYLPMYLLSYFQVFVFVVFLHIIVNNISSYSPPPASPPAPIPQVENSLSPLGGPPAQCETQKEKVILKT